VNEKYLMYDQLYATGAR